MKEVIRLTFWDHCIGGKSPVLCNVSGEVVIENDLFIVLRYWQCEVEDNDEYTTVLKSTIVAKSVARFE